MSAGEGAVLVTGASGFIGVALTRELVDTRKVVAMSRSRPVRGWSPGVSFVAGAFHSEKDLANLEEHRIGCLVHLGAVTGGCSEEDGLDVNVLGTRRLLRYLLDRGCRRFVLASSVAATGSLHHDFVPARMPIPDDHPYLARDAYGLSKAMVEDLTRYFGRLYPDAAFVNLRLGAVVDDETWRPEPIKVGTPMRFPFVELARVMLSDAVRALASVVDGPPSVGVRTYNVVGPDATCEDPVPEVVRALLGDKAEGLDMSAYERPGHARDPLYAMEKIERELGFVPRQRTSGRVSAG